MQLTEQFRQANGILEQIQSFGYEAYFVGGCVRDLLLHRNIGDIDIATSARPDVIQQIFNKVIPVGMEHGTVIVRHKHQSYEVTTFRVDDDYADQRHPDSVQFVKTIDQDLMRRDFTINALAMDKTGIIIDLFNGKEDIRKRVIRTVGDGYERFTEDPLRIMRALRFSSQLGFSLDEQTLKAIQSVISELKSIAVERILQETAKFFAGPHIEEGMNYFQMINLDRHLPVFKDNPGIMKQLPDQLKPLRSFGAVIAMFHFAAPAITIDTWTKQWKCSNKIKFEAESFIKALNDYKHDGLGPWLVYGLHITGYSDFASLVNMLFDDRLSEQTVYKMANNLPIHSKRELAINGTDIRWLFPDRQPGPWIGGALKQIEKQVVTGYLSNNKNVLKEWVKWNQHATG
ncbi:MAG TPA: CCA tRNA nucleotidyltransferase [Lentibacillus sp.]|uniref:CCA tRNA nucleotidyltransferase n=1 Tax=Lentibacillus sp. TaxID=1925746 RepID=UPI002B4B07A3|nr:CCA tRNA nucleotidyltransferase [Lentibacillus sp.]HLR63141.1 CCA tRNA nucleotidyltransferase [Lentibacillus sp.]